MEETDDEATAIGCSVLCWGQPMGLTVEGREVKKDFLELSLEEER